ncbi:hypothetical protein B0O99DRAFT_685082 [Bisporella sp. PMI_857]|nr:hypothetical protein B0O99DRAFT_685082 [Bisporella sp. PMI_857]
MVFKASVTFVLASCIGQLQWTWFLSERPLYDVVRYTNAANGPWGSMQLLWTQNIHNPLATLGAFILVATVPLDPIMQQLLTQYDCSVLLNNENATLPRTNMANNQNLAKLNHPPSLLNPTVYDPNDKIFWSCSTGNCTFSEFGTVGYCSSCEDLSTSILFNTTCVPPQDRAMPGIHKDCPQGNWPNIMSSLNYSLESSQPLWLNISSFPLGPEAPDVCTTAIDFDWRHPYLTRAIVLVGKTSNSDLNYFLGLNDPLMNCETAASAETWRCRGYGAAICALQPCVRTYNATIKAGYLEERVISQSSSTVWGRSNSSTSSIRSRWGMVDKYCISSNDSERLKYEGYKLGGSFRWLAYNVSQSPFTPPGQIEPDSLASSLLQRKCLYLMDEMISDSFAIRALWQDFVGTVQGSGSGLYPPYSTLSSKPEVTYFTGPPLLNLLYNKSGIEFEQVQRMFMNFSDILTAWVRTHGNETNSEPALGEAWHHATCVQANWAWMAFPGATSLFTLLFFILVVINAEKQHTPVWKLSPLAWIFQGPTGLTKLNGTKTSVNNMESKSKDIVISLLKNPS